MKKVTLLLMALVLCVSVTACIAEDTPVKEESGAESTTAENSKEETFGLNETAAFKNLKFTANKLEESSGTDFFQPENGKVFVGVEFTIENVSNEEQALSTLLLFDAYVDEVKCDYSLSAACVFDEGTLDGSLAPGKKMTGWYSVEIPATWARLELHVQSSWLSSGNAVFVFNK